VFFANKFEDLPIVQRVGDIIRVHRATVKEYNCVKHFIVPVNFNAAWVLFSPLSPSQLLTKSNSGQKKNLSGHLGFISDSEVDAETDIEDQYKISEFRPMAHFGKNYSTIEKEEQKLIRELRIWLNNILKSHIMLNKTRTSTLKEFASTDKYEYDFILRVLSIFRIDELQSEVRFIDENMDIGYTKVYNGKFRWLREGQVVKVKSASKYQQTELNSFYLKFSANILTVPNESRLA
jgi:Telomeric single stranded DNA binding POT1/CDC13